MNIRTFRIGGIHPEENKITAEMPTQVAPLPKQAILPLSQHIGAPAKPIVQKGDKVKVGTMIAEANGFVSAPIHSSVSGTVFKVDTAVDATGYRKPVIVINVEGDEWEETIDRSEKLETLAEQNTFDAPSLHTPQWETAFEQAAVYFLFRHLPAALEDGDIASKAAFAALSVGILRGLCAGNAAPTPDDLVEFARMYSSEVEYSEENLQTVFDWLYSDLTM